jgi:hypothetical protein
MKQIRDPRKDGIQLMSANKLIKKITSMPETSTDYIILSRRIEICGFACKLLQITQRYLSLLLSLLYPLFFFFFFFFFINSLMTVALGCTRIC